MAAKKVIHCGMACSVTLGAAGFTYGGITGAFEGFNRHDDLQDKIEAAFLNGTLSAATLGIVGMTAPVMAIPVLIGCTLAYVGTGMDKKP